MSEQAGPPPLPEGGDGVPPPLPLDDDDPLLLPEQHAEQLQDGPRELLGEKIDYANADELLTEFFAEVREVDRDNEVNRILGAFKINPYEQMGIRFDATIDQINRHYRKTSLLVHPDKCKHPRAKDAFDTLRQAQQALLNEERRKELDYQLNYVRDLVREERRKATKHDAAVRMAAAVHVDGRSGVEAEWEGSEEFHHMWREKSREVLAKAAWRKRKLSKRMVEEEARVEEEIKDEKARMKAHRNHEKGWEKTRENRVGTWRDFVKSGKDGKKKKTGGGGLKPPKQKTFDQDKTYVQRPVGEQFRPPPAVAPKPHRT